MSQQQLNVSLAFADGTVGNATATGNNAAWMCRCGKRKGPLLGYSAALDDHSAAAEITCDGCGRRYLVVAPGIKQRVERVVELT